MQRLLWGNLKMEKSDIAGIGFMFFFMLLNMGYEYYHTIAITKLQQVFASILLIISHIGYVVCIKNLKWVEK